MTGDLVMGYTSDDALLEQGCSGWVDLYKASPLFGTKVKLVAITGNHETRNAGKIATSVAEQSWLDIMAPYRRLERPHCRRAGRASEQIDHASLFSSITTARTL